VQQAALEITGSEVYRSCR